MVAVKPFDDAHREGEELGLWARKAAIALCTRSTLVEMCSPVFRRPYTAVGPQQRD
jgi:hypothetical protein